MKRRILILTAALAAAAVLVLGGATLAVGGGRGLIWDDDHYAKAGSLDDGKELLQQTKITLAEATASAQRAARGPLGQVDLERAGGRVVYTVDVGDREVRVDAVDGSIASVGPQS
jgi:uncharacterized membrane protein YkoI